MNLVYDRTPSDVYQAGQIIEKYKLGDWSLLTDAERAQLERGVYTLGVLNRVEAACEELRSTLLLYGYRAAITTKQWEHGRHFTVSERDRFIGNIKALHAAYYTFSDAPGPPDHFMGYAEANAIERILVDMYAIIPMMVASFVYSGQQYSGEAFDIAGFRTEDTT